MRKLSILFLFAIASLSSTTLIAQEHKEAVVKEGQSVQQDMEQVKLNDLPDAVKKTISETYAEHTAEKALKAKKEDKVIYYIKLQKDGEYQTVMIDDAGKVLEPENK